MRLHLPVRCRSGINPVGYNRYTPFPFSEDVPACENVPVTIQFNDGREYRGYSFSIDEQIEETMRSKKAIELTVVEERRAFLTKCASMLAGVSIVGIVAPLVQGCEPSQPIAPRVIPNPNPPGSNDPDAPPGTPFDISALDADGKALLTTVRGTDGMPVLLVRMSATDYRALSTLCTHERCQVDSQVPLNGPITCSCHGSQFRIDGTVKKGPAASSLKRYDATLDGTSGKLYVVIT
jgi:Rieske Fe-S protein